MEIKNINKGKSPQNSGSHQNFHKKAKNSGPYQSCENESINATGKSENCIPDIHFDRKNYENPFSSSNFSEYKYRENSSPYESFEK